MKLSAILTVFVLLFVNEASAQRRPPGPRPPRPYPYPVPPRRPVPPRPMPYPRPQPLPEYLCRSYDLYHYNALIHRFRWTQDCREALRDIHYSGRFCSEGAMYDRFGNFLRSYPSQYECRSWLNRRAGLSEALD